MYDDAWTYKTLKAYKVISVTFNTQNF